MCDIDLPQPAHAGQRRHHKFEDSNNASPQPRGNVLLVGIGGSGRQSLSRIGSYMCDLYTYQIAVTKQYGVPEFREDLKTLYSMAGVENKPTSFLFNDTQAVEEQFLEIVNNMLSTGEVANLYKSDEMEDVSRLIRPAPSPPFGLSSTVNTAFYARERISEIKKPPEIPSPVLHRIYIPTNCFSLLNPSRYPHIIP